MSDFTIILRSLRSRMFSTVTTVLTVAVAVALMLVLLSMRDAGRQAFERGSGNMHLLVSRDSSPLVAVLNSIFYANPPARPIDQAAFQKVADAFPWEFAIPVQQGDSYRGHPVLATTTEFFSAFQPAAGEPWSFASGRAFGKDFEVVLGSQVASGSRLKVGDRIVLTHGIGRSREGGEGEAGDAHDHHHHGEHVHDKFKYEVVGILAPTGSAHDRALFTSLASTWIIHADERREREDPNLTSTTAADLLDSDKLITGIYLRIRGREGSDSSALLPQAFDTLRRDPSITVASPAQQITGLFRIVSNIDIIFIGMAAVVMVSGGIAIMLALYNSMEQRRRQIAVLRVLGCSRGRIAALVVTESALLGILGAAAGLVLAYAGAQVVAGLMKQQIGLVIVPALPLVWILVVAVATVALAALAGAVPAQLAYRTSVAAHLRPLG